MEEAQEVINYSLPNKQKKVIKNFNLQIDDHDEVDDGDDQNGKYRSPFCFIAKLPGNRHLSL